MITSIEKISEIKRITYTTSHPIDMDIELINLHGSSEKLNRYLHLPVQSGSDKILKLMNRKYNKKSYVDIINKIRLLMPNASITADVIVAFPGESDEQFQRSLKIVEEIEEGEEQEAGEASEDTGGDESATTEDSTEEDSSEKS